MLWLKAFHIMSVIVWMAGLFYLPRLFVYHAEASNPAVSETFKIMEYRLLRVIMNPAMIAVWVTGPWLAWVEGVYGEPWLWIKVAFVAVLTGYHQALAGWRKDFAADRNVRTPRFYRLANEIPTVLMALIVLVVVLKPL